MWPSHSEHARSPLLLRLGIGAPRLAAAARLAAVVVISQWVALRGAHEFARRALRARRSARFGVPPLCRTTLVLQGLLELQHLTSACRHLLFQLSRHLGRAVIFGRHFPGPAAAHRGVPVVVLAPPLSLVLRLEPRVALLHLRSDPTHVLVSLAVAVGERVHRLGQQRKAAVALRVVRPLWVAAHFSLVVCPLQRRIAASPRDISRLVAPRLGKLEPQEKILRLDEVDDARLLLCERPAHRLDVASPLLRRPRLLQSVAASETASLATRVVILVLEQIEDVHCCSPTDFRRAADQR
mmetsp:Transcript_2054/g.4012  ORF Transcript_2054/g.4012 Transcript_2054/m.4012 type:complete len:296 (-) Transcript_2054:15-902(-)